MADDRHGGSLILRPRFLLFCLYCMGYVALRGSDEIMHQIAELRTPEGVAEQHIIGPNPVSPRWRRQACRVAFSPLMVVEEEARRVFSDGRGWMRSAGDYGRDLLE